MDQVIIGLLTGELDAASLLLLFIVGILTKRFVPWWIHEEVLEKLDEYEQAAPGLLEDISTLIDLLIEDEEPRSTNVVPDIRAKREALRKIHRRQVAAGQQQRKRANRR